MLHRSAALRTRSRTGRRPCRCFANTQRSLTFGVVAKDCDALASKPVRQSVNAFDILPRGGAAHIDRLARCRIHMALEAGGTAVALPEAAFVRGGRR